MARAGLAKNDENSLSCPMANLFVKIAAAVINGGCVCGLGTRIATSRLRRGAMRVGRLSFSGIWRRQNICSEYAPSSRVRLAAHVGTISAAFPDVVVVWVAGCPVPI